MDDKEFSGALFAATAIPSASQLGANALDACLAGNTEINWIKANFSRLLVEAQAEAYAQYRRLEAERGKQILIEAPARDPDKVAGESWPDFLDRRFVAINSYFLSLSQSRKTRAGSTFEAVVKALFARLGYPHTAQPKMKDGHSPDFVLPSLQYYQLNPTDCIILTCKRTLRERWRQIVTEGVPGRSFYLATMDAKVTSQQLVQMHRQNVNLLVPSATKSDHYPSAPNVHSFEDFFEDELDPSVVKWRKRDAF